MSKKVSINHYVDTLPSELWMRLKDQTHKNLSIVDSNEAQFIKFVLLHDTRFLSTVIIEEHVRVNIETDRVSKLTSLLRKSLGVSESIPIDMRFAGQIFREDDTLANLGAFYPDKVYFGLNFSVAFGTGVSKLREWDNYFVGLAKFITAYPESYSELCSDIEQHIKQSDVVDFNSEQLWRRLVLLRNVPGNLVNNLPIKSMQKCILELVSCVNTFYKPENFQYIYHLVNTLEWLTYIAPSALDSSKIGNQMRKDFVEQMERIIRDDNSPIALKMEVAWTLGWAGIACPYLGPEILPFLSIIEAYEEIPLFRQVLKATALRVGPLRSAYMLATASRGAGSFVPIIRDPAASIGTFTGSESAHGKLLKLVSKIALDIPDRKHEQRQDTFEQNQENQTNYKCRLSMGLNQQKAVDLCLTGALRFEGQTINPLNLNPESVSEYERRVQDALRLPDWRFNAQMIGSNLSDRLFLDHSLASRCRDLALGSVHNQEKNLSIKFKSSTGLLRLPLEYVYLDGFLVLKHAITRFITGVYCSRPPISGKELEKYKTGKEKTLNILLVASDTGGIPGVDQEILELNERLQNLLKARDLSFEIKVMQTIDATYQNVRDELMSGKYEWFHYAGHGSHDGNSPDNSALYFWEDTTCRNAKAMSAHELGTALNGTNLQFVYLSCCLAATQTDKAIALDDDFMGIVDSLIKNSIPSVLGFRWPVSDSGATMLATEFYESFLRQGDLGIALLDARRKVFETSKNDSAWISPILVVQD